jgi:hypothetical protein
VAFDDIIIAVHGIGEQSRFATVRSVATRLANSQTLLPGPDRVHPVAPQPLGYFHSDVEEITSVQLLDDPKALEASGLATIGFAEVFWADIPQEVVKEGRTLEETKAWARTVVARARSLCDRARTDPNRNRIVPPDFGLVGQVLDEMIQTIYVLESLTFLAQKAGLFKFDLRRVLEEYLGDVQLVTEFSYHRKDILGRFHGAMKSIHKQYPHARIHIVAHSEGTVVSFLGLLHAKWGREFFPANPKALKKEEMVPRRAESESSPPTVLRWLEKVHGFMTIGSPIDKHLLLWERLWREFDPQMPSGRLPDRQIHWRNYYDYGDPVGFKLDSARAWLATQKIRMFQFCGCKKCRHDVGFARYLLPGEAHNEYWNDSEVFENFIVNVVKQPSADQPKPKDPRPPPRSKPLVWFLSPTLPYAGCFLLLMLGVFFFYKAVHAFTHPSYDPLQRIVRFHELGVMPPEGIPGWCLVSAVCGISGLVAGLTLLARLPSLAVGKIWFLFGIVALLVGSGLYVELVPHEIRGEIGGRFWTFVSRPVETGSPIAQTRGFGFNLLLEARDPPTLTVLAFAALAGLSGLLVTSRNLEDSDRQQRWLFRGIRPLILCGALAVGLIVVLQLSPPKTDHLWLNQAEGTRQFTSNETALIRSARLTDAELRQIIAAKSFGWTNTVQSVGTVLATHPPAWPVLLASAAFLYLWWLSTLLFDLTFVWHRYIRRSTSNKRLREWNPYGFAPREDCEEDEDCCNSENSSTAVSK